MRPLTATDLHDLLDSELVWRRREMTLLVTTIKVADLATRHSLVRAGVPLLYAHWEGFGRECFQRYLEHVSYKNLKYKDLQPSFLYLTSFGKIQEIVKAPAKTGVKIMPELAQAYSKVHRNPFRKMIDTKSNLRFSVLEQLCSISGIPISKFTSDELFIIHDLCDARNEIAHGSASAPSETVFIQRRDKAFSLMTRLQTEIVNAAVNGSYKI